MNNTTTNHVMVTIDYSNEVNSGNKEWFNTDVRNVVIIHNKNTFNAKLNQSQFEHVITMIQDNYNENDIVDIINNYHHINDNLN